MKQTGAFGDGLGGCYNVAMGKPFQFSIDRMLGSMACLCLATAAVTWFARNHLPFDSPDSTAVFFAPLLLAIGALAAAIGLLSSQRGFFEIWSIVSASWFVALVIICLICLVSETRQEPFFP